MNRRDDALAQDAHRGADAGRSDNLADVVTAQVIDRTQRGVAPTPDLRGPGRGADYDPVLAPREASCMRDGSFDYVNPGFVMLVYAIPEFYVQVDSGADATRGAFVDFKVGHLDLAAGQPGT